MIHKVIIKRFKKFPVMECNLRDRALIAGPNNSGKTTILQALATFVELGEIWLESLGELERDGYGSDHRVDVDISSFRTLALNSFSEMWYNQDTREPISIRAIVGNRDIGFDLQYQDAAVATVGRLAHMSSDDLGAYAKNPLKALYIPSLSGLDVREPEYSQRVLATRLAHGKGGMVLKNLILATSRDDTKWKRLQETIGLLFGFELASPSGADPIIARYRHFSRDHWYDFVNGAAGFLQTVFVQSALLHSDATLFLVDEPDAHLHVLLKAAIYRIIREHCEDHDCQAIIATHSRRMIEEADSEQEQRLYLVAGDGLTPVRRNDVGELLKIPAEEIIHAETKRSILYLEGKSDLHILQAWASALGHPSARWLQGSFWLPTAERGGRRFVQEHFRALKIQVPTLNALEIRDRNGGEDESWQDLKAGELRIEEGADEMPEGMMQSFWSRYEIENYLLHPEALARFVSNQAGEAGVAAATKHMEEQLPAVLFDQPFEATIVDRTKGKRAVAEILTSAGVQLAETEYHQLASSMKPGEIHPDVITMLNIIADRFVERSRDR